MKSNHITGNYIGYLPVFSLLKLIGQNKFVWFWVEIKKYLYGLTKCTILCFRVSTLHFKYTFWLKK